MSKRVVIIGGGVGGISTAYNLRKLDKDLKITIISDRSYFGFTPSFPHLAIGWRRFEEISIPLAPILPKFHIDFINESAEVIDPKANKVILKSGRDVEYDYLVIATGPKLVFGVDGQEEYSASICNVNGAIKTNERLKEFFSNPGLVVIGTIPGTSCFGPAYEFAFMMKYELSKRGLRVPIDKLTKVEKDRVYYEDINGNVYEQ